MCSLCCTCQSESVLQHWLLALSHHGQQLRVCLECIFLLYLWRKDTNTGLLYLIQDTALKMYLDTRHIWQSLPSASSTVSSSWQSCEDSCEIAISHSISETRDADIMTDSHNMEQTYIKLNNTSWDWMSSLLDLGQIWSGTESFLTDLGKSSLRSSPSPR